MIFCLEGERMMPIGRLSSRRSRTSFNGNPGNGMSLSNAAFVYAKLEMGFHFPKKPTSRISLKCL